MNRIVREHYPVSDLPEDLRGTFGKSSHVRIVVEEVQDDAARLAAFDREIATGVADLDAGRIVTVDAVRSCLQARFGLGRDAAE
jgi:predicted transcriptional regulator